MLTIFTSFQISNGCFNSIDVIDFLRDNGVKYVTCITIEKIKPQNTLALASKHFYLRYLNIDQWMKNSCNSDFTIVSLSSVPANVELILSKISMFRKQATILVINSLENLEILNKILSPMEINIHIYVHLLYVKSDKTALWKRLIKLQDQPKVRVASQSAKIDIAHSDICTQSKLT